MLPPTVRFVAAEDVREEIGNKLSLSGFIAGQAIIVQGEAGNALQSLAIVAMFDGGDQAPYEMKMTLKAPSGKILHTQTGAAAHEPKTTMTLIFKFIPFPVPEFGWYELKVSLDGKEYDPFRIRIDNKA